MATTRIDMRLEQHIKASAEKAAALKGMKSLTEYVVQLIEKDAAKTIREHSAITVEENVFDRFIDACESAESPNKKLLEAKTLAETQGIS